MSVKITRTTDEKTPSLVMCLYGPGGVGKTTLATTAPKPILIDSERGSKALGARGIDMPVIHVESWLDVIEAWKLVKDNKDYETVVIDPIDRFLDLLITDEKAGGDMSIKKWGSVKDRMRKFIWAVKDSGKHVVFVAHETLDKDEDQQLRKPKLQVNLSGELVDLCDVVAHMRVNSEKQRALLIQPEPKVEAKDRFDAFPSLIEKPNLTEMIKTIHEAYNKPPFPNKPESKK